MYRVSILNLHAKILDRSYITLYFKWFESYIGIKCKIEISTQLNIQDSFPINEKKEKMGTHEYRLVRVRFKSIQCPVSFKIHNI